MKAAALCIINTFGIETTALRFGNVYGPKSNHKSSVVAKFIRQALKGETLEIYGDGNQSRTFCYVDDNVDACVAAFYEDKFVNDIVNIGSEIETSICIPPSPVAG